MESPERIFADSAASTNDSDVFARRSPSADADDDEIQNEWDQDQTDFVIDS